ncbi:hypothetical protein [Actinophytocola sp.]|uniref:hypothetical protein n=1 Tax=Actinophytocola sp. TaxID=1872138 RepID=UPI003D6A41E4
MGELWLVGVLVSAALALRILTEIVVIIWSLRADKAGREHAIKILQQLSIRRGRKPP